MASTTFTLYVKPAAFFPASPGRTTSFTAYVPIRTVSGLYSTGLTSRKVPKNSKPSALVPFIDIKTGLIAPEWHRWLSLELSTRKLGGINFVTVPQLTSFVTQTQVDAQLAAAQDQMAQANAQALQTLIQVVQTAGLAGASAIPAPVLARQETNPTPISPDFGETGGGAGE